MPVEHVRRLADMIVDAYDDQIVHFHGKAPALPDAIFTELHIAACLQSCFDPDQSGKQFGQNAAF